MADDRAVPRRARREPAEEDGPGLSGVTVRRVVPGDDLDAVGALVLRAYEGLEGGRLDDDYRSELADAASRAAAAEVVVAVTSDGRYVGHVTYVPGAGNPYHEFDDPGSASFRMLAVAPEAEGRGVGRALTQWCIDRARADGRARLLLHTAPVMRRAHRLYEQMGFARCEDLDWEPVPGLHLLAYGLELGPPAPAPPPGPVPR